MLIYHCHRCGKDYGGPVRGSGYRLRVCDACRRSNDPAWLKRGVIVVVTAALLLACSPATQPEPTFDTASGPMTASELEACGIGIDGHRKRLGTNKLVFWLAQANGDTVWSCDIDSMLALAR